MRREPDRALRSSHVQDRLACSAGQAPLVWLSSLVGADMEIKKGSETGMNQYMVRGCYPANTGRVKLRSPGSVDSPHESVSASECPRSMAASTMAMQS